MLLIYILWSKFSLDLTKNYKWFQRHAENYDLLYFEKLTTLVILPIYRRKPVFNLSIKLFQALSFKSLFNSLRCEENTCRRLEIKNKILFLCYIKYSLLKSKNYIKVFFHSKTVLICEHYQSLLLFLNYFFLVSLHRTVINCSLNLSLFFLKFKTHFFLYRIKVNIL